MISHHISPRSLGCYLLFHPLRLELRLLSLTNSLLVSEVWDRFLSDTVAVDDVARRYFWVVN